MSTDLPLSLLDAMHWRIDHPSWRDCEPDLSDLVAGRDLAERLGVGPGSIATRGRQLRLGRFAVVPTLRAERLFVLTTAEVATVLESMEEASRRRVWWASRTMDAIHQLRQGESGRFDVTGVGHE